MSHSGGYLYLRRPWLLAPVAFIISTSLLALHRNRFSVSDHLDFSKRHVVKPNFPLTDANLDLSLGPTLIETDPNNLPASSHEIFNAQNHSREWKEGYEKGVHLWKQLQIAQRSLSVGSCVLLQPTWRIYRLQDTDFTSQNGVAYWCKPFHMLRNIDAAHAIEHTNNIQGICTLSGYDFIQMETSSGIPSFLHNQFDYFNLFSTASRIIIPILNDETVRPSQYDVHRHEEDANTTLGLLDSDIPQSEWPRAPHKWSDAVFAIWTELCRSQSRPVSILKYVADLAISDGPTAQIIEDAIENISRAVLARRAYPLRFVHLVFQNRDPDFYAFLGSPYGSGVMDLLTNYTRQLATKDVAGTRVVKVKTIHAIHLQYHFTLREQSLVYEFRDIEPPGNTSSSATQSTPS